MRIADDLLWGAGAIAYEIFGTNTTQTRRRVYHLHEKSRLPTVKNGGTIIARRSQLQQALGQLGDADDVDVARQVRKGKATHGSHDHSRRSAGR
jgi:hypothetical protein